MALHEAVRGVRQRPAFLPQRWTRATILLSSSVASDLVGVTVTSAGYRPSAQRWPDRPNLRPAPLPQVNKFLRYSRQRKAGKSASPDPNPFVSARTNAFPPAPTPGSLPAFSSRPDGIRLGLEAPVTRRLRVRQCHVTSGARLRLIRGGKRVISQGRAAPPLSCKHSRACWSICRWCPHDCV